MVVVVLLLVYWMDMLPEIACWLNFKSDESLFLAQSDKSLDFQFTSLGRKMMETPSIII